MSDNKGRGRVDLSIPLDDDLNVGKAMTSGTPMTHLTVRGGREQAEKLVMRLLAELTGDEALFGGLEFREIPVALKTLGEIGWHGLDADLEGELSEPQGDVVATLATIHQADMNAQGMQ